MSVSVSTKIILWGRAAQRCSLKECRHELVYPGAGIDDPSLVGEVCHIVAEKENGPRGKSPLSPAERDEYENLILLCRIHHKVIDDQVATYTVDALKAIRAAHESWVRANLKKPDPQEVRDREIFAGYVDEWIKRARLQDWDGWTGQTLATGGRPSLGQDDVDRLEELREWLFKRIWPERYPKLREAFDNFRRVLADFLHTFRSDTECHGKIVVVRAFYKIDEWNPPLYEKRLKAFEAHVALIEDLLIELTRAANLICDRVRSDLDPSFRHEEGVLTVTTGPFESLELKQVRPEYRGGDSSAQPYAGIAEFKECRFKRDYCMGHPGDNEHLK